MQPDLIIGETVLNHFLFSEFTHRWVVVSDDNVMAAQGDYLKSILSAHQISPLYLSIIPGEMSKTREVKADLEDQLFKAGCGRDTLILAFGGGVVLDLAGFLASTYCRGVPVIYCPTTLLAMVDAAIGGKTAVNTSYGKNLIGSFYQPLKIVMDLSTLTTLPDDEYISALSEIVKTAMIADADLFSYLESNVDQIVSRDMKVIHYLVERCTTLKLEVVKVDPLEQGLRTILNYGHTIAHAIEMATHHEINHGLAVAYGLQVETKLAVKLGHLSQNTLTRLMSLLNQLGLPTSFIPDLSIDAIMSAMQHDKKKIGGNLHVVILSELGVPLVVDGHYAHPVDREFIREVLSS
jgi:3-dehydroquinate synthase